MIERDVLDGIAGTFNLAELYAAVEAADLTDRDQVREMFADRPFHDRDDITCFEIHDKIQSVEKE